MMKIGALLLGGFLVLASASAAFADAAANKQLVMAAFDLLFVQHKVDRAVDTYFDPSYIQHNPMAAAGAEPMRAFFKGFYATHPGASAKLDHVLADGDLVAVHYLMKPAPDDRGYMAVDIFRVAGGKIVEHWDVVQPVPEKSANTNGMF
ncbi:MAG TPA: nuclear transport factor 2 family protein [Rhizomicrobium sp.]|jgi:predicted SnoaL-like aldol condensation-catalyzing enzyme